MNSKGGLVGSDLEGGVRWLTLRRPQKRNALSRAMVAELSGALSAAADDRETKVVAIQGEGKDFSAGADLGELADSLEWPHEDRLADATRLGALFTAIRRHPRPVVAVVRGKALGGGCGLAISCDVVLAHPHAVFGFPEVRIGFVPALVMAMLRRRLAEGRIFELVATGEPVGAVRAVEIGLATRVVGIGFDKGVRRYVRRLASRPSGAVEATRRLIRATDGLSFDEAISMGAELNARARSSRELRDGLSQFHARRT